MNFFKRTKIAKNIEEVTNAKQYYDDCLVCKLKERCEKEGRAPALSEMQEAMRRANNRS
jgi:hypothetical protein